MTRRNTDKLSLDVKFAIDGGREKELVEPAMGCNVSADSGCASVG